MSDPRDYKNHSDSGFGSSFGVEGEFGTGGIGDEPFHLIAIPSALQLIVQFGCIVDNTLDLRLPANYTITALDASKAVTVIKVVPNDVYIPTFVTIQTTECTQNGAYVLTISAGKITKKMSNELIYLGEPDNLVYFTGVELMNSTVDYLPISIGGPSRTSRGVDHVWSDHEPGW